MILMGSFSTIHWIVVAVVIVLLFGTRKLPELGSGLGKAISNFRRSYKDGTALDVTPEKENQNNDKDPPKT
jgi:sec-independent protein translocase protein TatA